LLKGKEEEGLFAITTAITQTSILIYPNNCHS